jgi:AcrR family transcriptional regulator
MTNVVHEMMGELPVRDTLPEHEKRRQRLPADARVGQILDAAQREFADKGYTATRMDDIAQHSGLSKGGLYAHFKSKDAVFEALMLRSLVAPDYSQLPNLQQEVTPHALAEWLVEGLHSALMQEQAVATFRLLIAESERIPHLIEYWYRQVVQIHLQMLQTVLRAATEKLGIADSVVVREPWLMFAPVLHAMVMQILLGGADIASDFDYRAGHIALVVELLTPKRQAI